MTLLDNTVRSRKVTVLNVFLIPYLHSRYVAVGNGPLDSLHACSSDDVAATWQMGEWLSIGNERFGIECSSLERMVLSLLSIKTFTKVVNSYFKGVSVPAAIAPNSCFLADALQVFHSYMDR